jgi:hypothetical protein
VIMAVVTTLATTPILHTTSKHTAAFATDS